MYFYFHDSTFKHVYRQSGSGLLKGVREEVREREVRETGEGYEAVSYTHLDVYKRQTLHCKQKD